MLCCCCVHESREKLTTCYTIVGEHPSMATHTAASENHVTQIVLMKTGNSSTDEIYHSKIAYNVLSTA